MPIEQKPHATICTGEGVNIFRLVSIKGMLKLEASGFKTRGGALRPRLAKELGLYARAPYQAFIDAIDAKIATHRNEDGSSK